MTHHHLHMSLDREGSQVEHIIHSDMLLCVFIFSKVTVASSVGRHTIDIWFAELLIGSEI